MFLVFFCAETTVPVCPPACGQALYYGAGVERVSSGLLVVLVLFITVVMRYVVLQIFFAALYSKFYSLSGLHNRPVSFVNQYCYFQKFLRQILITPDSSGQQRVDAVRPNGC